MESAIGQVLSNGELVEIILEYSCTGQHWNEGLRLRQVCKLWRDNCFKGLVRCKHRPWVKLPKDFQKFQDFQEKFQELFPQNCSLPLKLKVQSHIGTTETNLIERNSKSITNLEMSLSSIGRTPSDVVYQLLNLQSVSVRLTPHFILSEFSKVDQLLSQLIKKSRHLKQFSLTIDPNESLPEDFPFPPRLTHLNLNTKFPEVPLTILMGGDLKHLADLCLTCIDPKNADMHQVKKVFDKYSDQLTNSTLVLSNYGDFGEIKLPPISSLKELHVKAFHGINIKGLTTNFFLGFGNLTTLKLGLTNWLSLISPGTTLEHLKFLCVYGDINEAPREQLEALESLGSFNLPNLEHLECKYFTPKTLRSFAPRFFQNSKVLRSLFLDSIFYEPFQLTSMLTGRVTNVAVLKETSWPQNADSLTPFTELKCLETLSIANEALDYKYDLEPFAFRCAFLQIPTLKKLNVTKNIVVRKTLAKDWKNEGRKLYLIKKLLQHSH